MARRQEQFATITTQGALLPASLLARIANNDQELQGLRGEDYHLAPGERLGEMINRSWNRAVGAWASLRPALQDLATERGERLTSQTRDRWLLVLMQELGFGRLQSARPVEVDGRAYPVSHLWGSATRVPFHLVGAGIDLDNRTAGVVGAARMSPHSLVQELLNQWDEALWGVVSNGLRLRLLRDNASLTRQAFVEFDLEAMMEGEVYSDFVLLWLLLHESRFEAEAPADCWLERWMKEAEAQGTRALDHLRDGVERAITALGEGFLAQPSNGDLREGLRTGGIETQQYYRLLLRLVYRLLFLFVAEGRDLLLSPDADTAARERYVSYYSMDRLRRLAERSRGTSHPDLFESLKVVMGALDESGLPTLGLPALGSMLWSREAIGELGECRIANHHLLRAIRALAFVESADDRVIRPVDYRNLGPEELGSIYESLLELHPALNVDAGSFELATAGGHERKTTGSYYTPTPLITSLLDTALEPVLDDAVRQRPRGSDRERALLSLKVVDPACGSGHFLLAAAQRIARRLAAARTGDDEPSPGATRAAVRDVIANCIYAVDVNPMAVELCKVSLWMEALDPGRPLSFLDHRIQCGHSLLGATPRLLSEGIPDAAYKPIEGDDKKVAASWRGRNKRERGGQLSLALEEEVANLQAPLTAGVSDVERAGGDSIGAVREQERRYRALVESPDMRRARLAADAWCSAFVTVKADGEPAITERVRRQLAADPDGVAPAVRERVEQLGAQFRFLHWHLAFPDVFGVPRDGETADNGETGWIGGFDVVLGNPPWDQLQFQETEWFAARQPEIAALPGERRKNKIAELAGSDPILNGQYREAVREVANVTHLVRNGARFPLCGRGRVNTYSVFAETMRSLIAPSGRAGVIVPTGIATDDTTKAFFASLVDGHSLVSLYDFENAAPIFPGVHRSYKFCLLTMTGSLRPVQEGAEFMFFARRAEDLQHEERRFRLTAEDFRLFNPNTRTCPIFRTRRDAEITRSIYERVPVLIDRTRPDGNPWEVLFRQGLFNMTSDSGLFRTRSELEEEGWTLEGNVFRRGEDRYLPLYEGKMFHHFDHRFASYENGEWRELTSPEKSDAERLPFPRYWVSETEVLNRVGGLRPVALPAWRDIARSTDERTTIAAIVPFVGFGHQAPLMFLTDHLLGVLLTACLSSMVLDYVARSKVGGTHLTYFIVEQLPVLSPSLLSSAPPWSQDRSVRSWITPRVAELTCTSSDMAELSRALGCAGGAIRWEGKRREVIRAELDAAFFHLYGIDRIDVGHVLDTFSVAMQQELRDHGEYHTKRLVLERYDALAAAIAGGAPYETPLDPPPADPRVAHQRLAKVSPLG